MVNTYSSLTFPGNNTLTIGLNNASSVFSGSIIGAGGGASNTSPNAGVTTVVKTGTGTLTLAGPSTYTGPTTISGGTLQLGNGGATGSIASTSITDNGALAYNLSSATSYGNTLSGTGGLLQLGGGTTTLSGAAITYSGSTAVNAGQLVLQNTTGYVSNTAIASGGTLNVALSSGWTISTAALNITGSGTLVKSGSGLWMVGALGEHVNFNLGPGGFINILSGEIQCNYNGTSFGNNQAGVNIAAGAILDFFAENGQMDYLTGGGTLQNNFAGALHGVTIGVAGGSGTFGGVIQNGPNSGGYVLSLTKSGSGVEVLSGTNTYSGATTISGGTLQLGTGTSGQDGSLANTSGVTNNAALVYNLYGNQTPAYAISGSGAVYQLGGGVTTLNLANTYSGNTLIGGGTLALGNASALQDSTLDTSGSGALNFGSLTAVTLGGLVNGGNLALANSAGTALTLSVGNNNQTTTYAGTISGSGSLTKIGTGGLTLTGSNNYTGGTTISSGTLAIGGAGLLGGGNYSAAIADNGGALVVNLANNQTFSGAMSGGGALYQLGSGTTVLSGASTISGSTTISAGTLRFDLTNRTATAGNPNNLGSISVGPGGTLELYNTNTTVDNGTGFLTAGTVVSGAGTINKTGAGYVDFCNSSIKNFAGSINVLQGTLASNASDWSTSAGSMGLNIASGASFDVRTGGVIVNTLNGSGTVYVSYTNGGALTVGAQGGSSTFSGIMQNGGSALSLTKAGSGMQTFSGPNFIYTGPTTISGGTLALANMGGNGSGGNPGNPFVSSISVGSAGTLVLSATNTNVDSMIIGFNNTGTAITGSGTITKTGSGWTEFDYNVMQGFSGQINIQAGTLGNGYGRSTWGGSTTGMGVYVASGAWLDLRGNGIALGSLTGSGSVGNTFTNFSTIGNGTLTVGLNNASSTFAGSIVGNGTGATNTTFNAGPTSLVKTGSGIFTLTGSNPYSGTTTISGGTLAIGNGGATGTLGSGGAVTDNALLQFSRSDNGLVVSNAIGGSGSVTQWGSGLLTLTGANGYSGGTTISAGTLQVGNGGTAGSLGANVLNNTVADNAVLAFSRADTGAGVTFNNNISGSGSVMQIGSGRVVLAGSNSYSGGTQVSAGTLAAGSNAALGGSSAGPVTINAGMLDLNGYNVTAGGLNGSGGAVIGAAGSLLVLTPTTAMGYSGTIGGAAGLTLNAPGIAQTLSGSNTYAGATTVTAGTLALGPAGTLGTSGITLAPGAVLDVSAYGNGGYNFTSGALVAGRTASPATNVLGSLNMQNSSLNVAAAGVGATMTISGNVALSGATLVYQENDQVALGGALTLSGTDYVALGAPVLSGTYTVFTGTSVPANAGSYFAMGSGASPRQTYAFNSSGGTAVTLVVAGQPGILTWTGSGASGTPNTWDTAASFNWYNQVSQAADMFYTNDNVTFDDSAGSAAANVAISGTVQPGAITVSNTAVNYTLAGGVIGGIGALVKNGPGSLTLSNSNTYSGGTTLNAGVVNANAAQALGTGALTLSGGTLNANAAQALPAAALTVSGGTLNANAAQSPSSVHLTSGAINAGAIGALGSGAVVQNGGVLNLSYSQAVNSVTLNAGLMAINDPHAVGTGTFTIAGGTLDNTSNGPITLSTNNAMNWSGNFTFGGSNPLNLGTGTVTLSVLPTITLGGSGALTFGGAMAGANGLTTAGSGTLVLSGGQITYTGPTTINAGVVQLQDTTAFASAVTVNANGTLNSVRTAPGLANRLPIMGNAITGSGVININNSGSGLAGGWTTVSGPTGSLNFSGTININSGTFSRDNTQVNTIEGTATVNVAAGAAFAAGRGGNSTIGAERRGGRRRVLVQHQRGFHHAGQRRRFRFLLGHPPRQRYECDRRDPGGRRPVADQGRRRHAGSCRLEHLQRRNDHQRRHPADRRRRGDRFVGRRLDRRQRHAGLQSFRCGRHLRRRDQRHGRSAANRQRCDDPQRRAELHGQHDRQPRYAGPGRQQPRQSGRFHRQRRHAADQFAVVRRGRRGLGDHDYRGRGLSEDRARPLGFRRNRQCRQVHEPLAGRADRRGRRRVPPGIQRLHLVFLGQQQVRPERGRRRDLRSLGHQHDQRQRPHRGGHHPDRGGRSIAHPGRGCRRWFGHFHRDDHERHRHGQSDQGRYGHGDAHGQQYLRRRHNRQRRHAGRRQQHRPGARRGQPEPRGGRHARLHQRLARHRLAGQQRHGHGQRRIGQPGQLDVDDAHDRRGQCQHGLRRERSAISARAIRPPSAA